MKSLYECNVHKCQLPGYVAAQLVEDQGLQRQTDRQSDRRRSGLELTLRLSACSSEAGRCLHRAGHSGVQLFLRSGWESGSLKPCTERSHRHSAICESNKKCHFKKVHRECTTRNGHGLSVLTHGSRLTPAGQRGRLPSFTFLNLRKVTQQTEQKCPAAHSPTLAAPGLTVPSGLGAPPQLSLQF